jgi:hexosaminidase
MGEGSKPALAATPPVRIIPQPKSLRPGAGVYRLPPTAQWSVTAPKNERRPERALSALLHLDSDNVKRTQAKDLWTTLRLGSLRSTPSKTARWARNPEGYRLRVTTAGIEIQAPSPQGAFYGVQTLAQVLRRSRAGWECPELVIEDWPVLPFRGAHFFPSASGTPFHRKLIERVFSRYKLNHAVIQCEAAKWDTHPEIAHLNSASKDDLRGLVQLCRRQFMEPVPLVNCPGHGQWMFRNGSNLDFVEDPRTPYAYCVKHPGAQKFIREVIGEAVEVFRPKLFHLGHDEVTLQGRFPNPQCPRCGGRSVTELVLENARGLSTWLSRKGVRSIVWGDMLFAREEGVSSAHAPSLAEAHARRRGLPKGIAVADWHYNTRGGYPSLQILNDAGLSSIACTWYEPANIHGFAREAARVYPAGKGGLLQTTWAGYFPDEKVLSGIEVRQFTAFILAAEYAWSGRAEPPSKLSYDYKAVFHQAYARPYPISSSLTLRRSETLR